MGATAIYKDTTKILINLLFDIFKHLLS